MLQVGGKEVSVSVNCSEPTPGFLPGAQPSLMLRAVYKPLRVMIDATVRSLTLVQVSAGPVGRRDDGVGLTVWPWLPWR